MNKSVIMSDNDKSYIISEIENKMNKKIKQLKKLYQATIDGDGPINFHLKCDNIPNTLTLIKSEGGNRFGGFTAQTWESSNSKFKGDKYAFLFSLDKKKIYRYKNDGYAILCGINYGPIFGRQDISVCGNSIQEKKLIIRSNSNSSYINNGEKFRFSENENSSMCAAEYEVFQVIF